VACNDCRHLPEDWQQQLGLAPFNVGSSRAAMAAPAAVAAADAGDLKAWWGAALVRAPDMPGQQQPSKRARELSAAELALAAADSLFDVQGTSCSSSVLPPDRKRVCSGGDNNPHAASARGVQRHQLPLVLVPQASGVPGAQGPNPQGKPRFVLDLRSPQSYQEERQQLAGVASGPPQGPTAAAEQPQQQQTRAPCAALDLRPDDLGQTSENGSRQPEHAAAAAAGQGNAMACGRDDAEQGGLLALISPPAGAHGPSTAASTTGAWVARTGPGGVPLPPPAMASVSAAAAVGDGRLIEELPHPNDSPIRS
jgi:hypothetical protein